MQTPDAVACASHDLEVGVVELHAGVGRVAVGDGGFHLGGELGDLVRGADIAGVLRELLAFDVPCDRALSAKAGEVGYVGLGLVEHAALERGETGRRVDVQGGRVCVVEVAAGVVGVAGRVVGVSGAGAGEEDGADGAAVGPVQKGGVSLCPIRIRVGREGVGGRAGGCEAE